MSTRPEQPAAPGPVARILAAGDAVRAGPAERVPRPGAWWRRLAPAEWTAVSLFLACAGFAAWSGRHLWADGAYFFVEMVAHNTFSVPDLPREHARYLTQGPALLLMAAGVHDGELLSFVFGLGHLLPAPIGLLVFLLVVPSGAWRVRWAGCVAAGLVVAISTFAVSEAMVLAATAVPLLGAVYLRPRDAGPLGVAAVLHLVAIRSYQLYPVLGVFVIHAVVTAARAGVPTRAARILWGVHGLLAVAGCAIAVWSLVGIRGSPNTAFALHTLLDGLRDPPVASLTVAAAALLLAGIAPGLVRGSSAVVLLGCFALGIAPWVWPASNDPSLGYIARGFGAVLAVGVVGTSCALHASGWAPRAERAWRGRAPAALGPALLLAALSWDVSSTVEWRGFRDVAREELQRLDGCGVVPVMDTLLWRERVGTQMLRRYTWFWSSPYLVAALAPEGPIRVVLSNPPAAADAVFRGPPPDLSRIGKSWDYEGRTCSASRDERDAQRR